MAALQEPTKPPLSTPSQLWRKRSAPGAVAPVQHPEKRFKQTPTNSSSDPTSGENGVGGEDRINGQVGSNEINRAERWFNNANDCPKDVPFVDDDPPYYLPKESSSEENVAANGGKMGASAQDYSKIGPTGPTRSLLAQMDAHNDNTDDFRSVIDDLTVQNKKLKQKLRKYENLHCSHLQEDKLFEVRVHGLTAERKKELEETLRSFASSVVESSPRRNPPGHGHASGPTPLAQSLMKPSSSSTSLSKPQDSGYASNSGVGVTGPSPPNQTDHAVADGSAPSKRQNVNNYLQDIPKNLAPKPLTNMSDRSKRKLVVRRLEQLFTGRGARTRHNQSKQQQEVSQSAAQADRRRIEAVGRRPLQEGTREAHILPDDTDLPVDTAEDSSGGRRSHISNEGSRSRSTQGSQNSSSPRSPEQRPTRPLDLDLHRASVPSDNMEYIRHLGLVATGDAEHDESASNDEWVYLNLLTSMAQLHTVNVTSEFIRKALSEVSEKFELSPDGTKVRWLGGYEGTKMSSDSGESDEQTNSNSSGPSMSTSQRGSFPEALSEGKAQERPGTGQLAVPQPGVRRRPIGLTQPINDATSKFQYRPLFYHRNDSEESDHSGLASDSLSSSEVADFTTGVNSGSNALQDREARLRGRRKDDGPIIFYNRAKFCTDLSGDPIGARADKTIYSRVTEHPIGAPPSTAGQSDESVDRAASSPSRDTESMETDKSSNGEKKSALDLEDLKSSISDCLSISGPAMAMEVSGLGGVRPEDNFLVKVQVRHADKKKPSSSRKVTAFSRPKGPVRKFLHSVSKKSVDAFREGAPSRSVSPMTVQHRPEGRQQQIHAEILSATKTNLEPSALPPPSFVHPPFASESDDEDSSTNADGEISSSEVPNNSHPYMQHHQGPNQPTSLRHHQSVPQGRLVPSAANFLNYYHHNHPRSDPIQYSTSSSSNPTSGDGSAESSSIDLLAHARELDPEMVAAREREFERNYASRTVSQSQTPAHRAGGSNSQRVAPSPEARPAASSAATYGGESIVGESPATGQRKLMKRVEEEAEAEAGEGDGASEADSMSVDRESGGSDKEA